MKLIELFEAPIADYETYSDTADAPASSRDWNVSPTGGATISKDPAAFSKRSSSFTDKRDRTLLTNPKAIQKMKNMFKNTDHNFHFYMVNSKEARHFSELGLVNRDWLDGEMPSISPLIPNNWNGITVIFTGNTGAEKVPMSAWIMAHRIGHAINRIGGSSSYEDAERRIRDVTNKIFKDYYNKDTPSKGYYPGSADDTQAYSLLKKKFYEEIGTFRSARQKNLRADFEFLNEVFAQWLITSTGIKFNPVPKKVITRKAWGHDAAGMWGRGDEEYANQLLEELAEELGYIFDNMLGEITGKILVM